MTEFVERGIQMQDLSPRFEERPLHDLYLLHCAIFAGGDGLLKSLAERVVDASRYRRQDNGEFFDVSGYQRHIPRDDGDLFTSAWCGMLKYWILGDQSKSVEQTNQLWKARRDIASRASTKVLMNPWLDRNWAAFAKAQGKDFAALWARARKDGLVVSENTDETIVNISRLTSLPQSWCWAHCGMALLAYRLGANVVTDSFWLPPHALKCADFARSA